MPFSYVYPPDIGNDPHVKLNIVEFRDRNLIKDTGSDESSSVDTFRDVYDETGSVNHAVGASRDQRDQEERERQHPYSIHKEKQRRAAALESQKGVVYLPLPSGIQNEYAIGWEMVDMQLVESLKDSLNNQEGLGSSAMDLGTGFASVLYGDLARRFTGMAPNPRKQAIFQSVEPRTFSFSYSFNPRNESDARIVQNIYTILKMYSLPSETAWQAFYDFPAEFKIEFGNVNKLSFPEIAHCVCTGISSNLDTDGRIQIMSDGRPATVNLTMNFLETELKTRQNPG